MTRKIRFRGFGSLEIILSVTIGFSAIVGSLVLLERASENSKMTDLTQSATVFSALALESTDKGRTIEQGDVSSFLGIRELPGFNPDQVGRMRHAWGGRLDTVYYGGDVFRLSLDTLSVKRCGEIVTKLSTKIDTPVGGVFPTIGDVFMDKDLSFDAASMLDLCEEEANDDGFVRAGWFFARDIGAVRGATGFTRHNGGEVVVAEAEPDEVEEEVVGEYGTEGEGTTIDPPPEEPDPTPEEPDPAPEEEEPKVFEFNPSWSIVGLDWIYDDKPQQAWGNKNVYEEWGVNIKSYWLPFPDALPGQEGMGFKIYGDGSPVMLDENGDYLDEGILGEGTVIKLNTPPCGEKPVIYIEFDDGTIGSWDLQDQTWPNNWQPGKENCGSTTGSANNGNGGKNK